MSELPHDCRYLPDEGPPAIAITGDLRIGPILIADWQPGVLTEPFDLVGNGTYRLNVAPCSTSFWRMWTARRSGTSN